MSVTVVRTPFFAIFGPIFFSVLRLSVQRSTDQTQERRGFQGIGL